MLSLTKILLLVVSFNVLNALPQKDKLPSLMTIAQRYNLPISDTQAILQRAVIDRQSGWIGPLCSTGADPNGRFSNGLSYLYRAVIGGNTATVKALLDSGADIHGLCWDGWDSLKAAVEAGDKYKAQQMAYGHYQVRPRTETNDKKWFKLDDVINSGDMKEAGKLMKAGKEANGVNQDRYPLLWFASRYQKSPDIRKLLTDRGSDPRQLT